MPSRTRKNTKRKHKQSGGNLRSSYGVLTLQKGTRLYHASSNALCTLPDKPVLFLTLHPSEWYMEDSHISVIELQRDVSLLFMVKLIHNMRVYSALNDFIGQKNSNLAKMDYENIKMWLPDLQKEYLDGWFSSIENKTSVEFAIFNDPTLLKLINCIPIQYNWTNSTYTNDMNLVPKKWGTLFPITTYVLPVHLELNSRFKSQIQAYINRVKEEDPLSTAFSHLLENAVISYFDAPQEVFTWRI